jgi:aryl-alcohol dehydrogenase-like predicted oxidoreductase
MLKIDGLWANCRAFAGRRVYGGAPMQQRTIGTRRVSELGYGGMYLSIQGRPSEAQALEALQAAIDGGVTFIDTADSYCLDDSERGHNERLIAKALAAAGKSRDEILVATKGGHTRPGGSRWGQDGRPEYLKWACDASLKALGVDVIDLYQFHRPDPKVPFEESVGAVADLKKAGKVRMVGLSNVSVAQIDAAQRLVEIVSVQNQFSHWERGDEHNGVLQACTERGIAYLPYSPFGGGGRAKRLGEIEALADAATSHGATPYQIVLAWLLAKSPVIIPIPCSTRAAGVRENVGAAQVTLSAEEIRAIDAAKPPA